MITYWFASQSAHFHPSVFAVAASPNGREVSPHGLPVKPSGRLAKARSRSSVPFFLATVFIMAISSTLLLTNRVQEDIHWIAGLFGPLVLIFSLGQIDRFFWMVRRAHDMGKSWLWAGLPILLCGLTPAPIAIGFYVFEAGITAAIVLGWMLFVILPSGLTLFWIYGGQSQAGENRYGPPAEPIPDYWSE